MKGNSAIIKCLIPSFVADFVHVVAWIDETNEEILHNEDSNIGIDIKSKDNLSSSKSNILCYYFSYQTPN